MIDLHTHILFDCDHGVQDKKTYTKIMEQYAKNGFDTVVLTPHLHHPNAGCKSENIEKNFEEAREIAHQLGVEVYLGCELYFDGTKSDMDVYAIGNQYVLAEFPTDVKPIRLLENLQGLQARGYTIIVAHVERYPWMRPDSQLFRSLRDMGCLIQVNMESVRNKKARPYLKTRMVDIIASDNHGDKKAPKKLRKVLEKYPEIRIGMDSFYFGE